MEKTVRWVRIEYFPAGGPKYGLGDAQGLFPRYPDDPDSAAPKRRCNGGNGVIAHVRVLIRFSEAVFFWG